MLNVVKLMLLVVFVVSSLVPALAETNENQHEKIEKDIEKESPWLLTPTFSSSPKLGNSLGGIAGYLLKFDEKSPTSMFAVMGNYSDTDSSIYGAFGQTFFSEDAHRITGGFVRGKIENDYEDFLGTGFDALTTDDLSITFFKYLKRLKNDWFFGAQLVAMDYQIKAKDEQTQSILEAFELSGFESNGLGLVVERDTRDSQHSPKLGSHFTFNNIAFRETLGGDDSFDTYTANYSSYFNHGGNHVLAARITGRWTHNAPVGGYSSVDLRGYTRGEYLARHATTFEIEERYSLGGNFGLTAFLGAACLYGDKASCSDGENWFPAGGVGMTYMIKPKERMVVRAEIAVGKGDNEGFYIQFGNSF